MCIDVYTLKSIVQAFIQKKIDRGEKINISEKMGGSAIIRILGDLRNCCV